MRRSPVLVMAVGVLGATLVAIAQATCTAHTQCPNDPATRANRTYCDTANQCFPCAWVASDMGRLYWSSCDATAGGNGDAIVSPLISLAFDIDNSIGPLFVEEREEPRPPSPPSACAQTCQRGSGARSEDSQPHAATDSSQSYVSRSHGL